MSSFSGVFDNDFFVIVLVLFILLVIIGAGED
ncbi:YjcZ family sporulation protein [Ammoniphilus resinae]|uniref:Uncharacterized protein (TIGR01732 family) n=1 Tax=Ammoniphilus resinae TaxID=861532 RepID=A0ABS4GLR4_9BACL|nr:YjcZ family sporulation protein [Ammoniphilus resinae]MBP1931186.1 uncharacterized protein (TIGR01732 family) [Ammoniphilus resinae]